VRVRFGDGILEKRRTAIAQRLRKDQTTAESIVWRQLRRRQVNCRKWRRQQPIGPYVVDFCCQDALLIVEVDGDVHDGQEIRDSNRQEFLEDLGYRVMRVTNDDVFRNLDGVMQAIWQITQIAETPSS